jgi:septum formation protein
MIEQQSATSLVLASASPRRLELIGRLGLPFIVAPSDVDETTAPGLAPETVATSLALLKARAVAIQYPGHVVIGADTVVIPYDDQPTILGKPRDDADATRMLRLLRDRWHRVATGVAVIRGGAAWSDVVSAGVRMGAYSDAEIAGYVASGEPHDKAGAYAVQGLGGRLVVEVNGSELTVVGLPLRRLAELLQAAGVALPIAPASIVDRWVI